MRFKTVFFRLTILLVVTIVLTFLSRNYLDGINAEELAYKDLYPPVQENVNWPINYAWHEIKKNETAWQRIYGDSLHFVDTDGDAERVVKVAEFILKKKKSNALNDFLGTLPVEHREAIYPGLMDEEVPNELSVFSFLASASNLAIRWVESDEMGGIAFPEVFLRQQPGWAFVDLSAGNILVRKNGRYLNTIELQKQLKDNPNDSSVIALHFDGNVMSEVPLPSVASLTKQLITSKTRFKFYYADYLGESGNLSVATQIKKLFYVSLNYGVHATRDGKINMNYFLSNLCSWLFMIVLLNWIFFGFLMIRSLIRRLRR